MAYAVKYYGEFYDRQNGRWRVEILLDGYGGSEQEITLANTPVTFSWSGDDFKYSPIITSSIEVKVVQTSNYQFREFLVTDESDYLIRLKKYNGVSWASTPVWWVGFLLPDVLTEQYTDTPNVLTIRASDGLTRLKNIYYVSSKNSRRDNFYTGLDFLSNILCKCLLKIRTDYGSSNYTWNYIIDYLNTFEDSHNSVDSNGKLSPLDQTKVDQGAFVTYDNDDKIAMSCWDVLENILKVFGARMFLAFDTKYNEGTILAWHIITINDYDGNSIARNGYEIYDGSTYYNLDVQETINLNETISTTVANFASSVIYANRNHEMSVIPAASEVITGWKPKNQADSKWNNLVPSGEFEYHVNNNLSDWNNAVSLKNWTISSGTYSRQKNPYKSNDDPYYQNIYGVEMNTRNTYLSSSLVTVGDGVSGVNLLVVKVRAYYLVPTLNGTYASEFVEIIDSPRARVVVTIDDGVNTHYLYRTTIGYGWKTTAPTGNELIYIKFGGALIDYDKQNLQGVNVYPENVMELNVAVAMPTLSGGAGDMQILLYQADRFGNAGYNERRITTLSGTYNETVRVNYEFCRANLATADGNFGNFDVKYISNNSNVRTSVEPINVETFLGDPVDGEGFNVGSLRDAANNPTSLWEWNGTVGGANGDTIHKVLMYLINRNYSGISLKLSGDFNTAYKIVPQNHFQLSDNSTTADMILADCSWDVQNDIANCVFIQNRDLSPTLTIVEQHVEDIPSIGATSGGSLSTSVPISIDPNIDAG